MTSKSGGKQPATVSKIDYNKTSSEEPPEDAAEAAEAEAEDKRHVLQVPTGDGETLELVLPRRFKRFKFMRKISGGDLWGAIEVIGFSEKQLERLENADVDEDEFETAVKALAQSVTGSKDDEQGKSSGS